MLNEAQGIRYFLQHLQPLRLAHCEVIIVDGGSQDNTVNLIDGLADKIMTSAPGRAAQMNLGAAHAKGEVLLFLHADTFLPGNAISAIEVAMSNHYEWGRFDMSLSNSSLIFKVIASLINLRTRLTSIAGGDQAMFITRGLFEKAGGFASIALMEDVEICQRLKKHGRPACLKEKVVSSSRRWEQHGVIKTVLTMWLLKILYYSGVAPARLAKIYGYKN